MHMPSRLPETLGSTAAFVVQEYLTEMQDYAVARSARGEIGVTWNDAAHPGGYPKAFGNQQWFILPPPIAMIVLATAMTAEMLNGQ